MTTRSNIRHLMTAIAVLLSLAALTAVTAAPRRAASSVSASDAPGTVRIRPPLAGVGVGGTVTVEVWLENVGNYYGVDLKMHFDASRLRVASAKVTPLWDVFDQNNHFTIKNQADNSTGTVWYAVTNLNPAEPFTGTGRTCSITFTGISPGASALDLYYVKGSTPDGDALFPTQVDGAIVVGQIYRSRFPVVPIQ